jgi:hypothetical protein
MPDSVPDAKGRLRALLDVSREDMRSRAEIRANARATLAEAKR